jgi:hypothetical protein
VTEASPEAAVKPDAAPTSEVAIEPEAGATATPSGAASGAPAQTATGAQPVGNPLTPEPAGTPAEAKGDNEMLAGIGVLGGLGVLAAGAWLAGALVRRRRS